MEQIQTITEVEMSYNTTKRDNEVNEQTPGLRSEESTNKREKETTPGHTSYDYDYEPSDTDSADENKDISSEEEFKNNTSEPVQKKCKGDVRNKSDNIEQQQEDSIIIEQSNATNSNKDRKNYACKKMTKSEKITVQNVNIRKEVEKPDSEKNELMQIDDTVDTRTKQGKNISVSKHRIHPYKTEESKLGFPLLRKKE